MERDKGIAERDTLMYPLLEDLLARIPSKYEVVVLASLRAREIIRKQKLGASFDGELDADVAREGEALKPLSRALAEIAEGKLDREKMYLLEYLESFRRGDEDISAPPLAGGGTVAAHPAEAAQDDLPFTPDEDSESSTALTEEDAEEDEQDGEN